MIEVIVNVRDAVFAALVAWTGVADGQAVAPQKDKVAPHSKPAAIEKPMQTPAPKVF